MEEVWHGNKWAGAEKDRTTLCSCTGFVFLAVFVTVKTSDMLLITSKFLQMVGYR